MDVIDAIKDRRSIRNYKPDAVPQEILREILEIASQAPSSMNTQPWEFFVLTGEVIEKVKKANIEKLEAGEKPHEEHNVVGWEKDNKVYRDRQITLAKQLFASMDIPREDKEKRASWLARGFRFFDAPAAIIIVTDKSLTEIGPSLDLGGVMQTICLTALKYDLGTCIEDQGVLYPEVVREITGIPESKRIIISIAIGYPNMDFPANHVISSREDVESITTWCGF
ncbi:nitroreductase [Thermodesulfobacteriota bacterium]